MDTLLLTQRPSSGSDIDVEPRLIENTFGDGYEQSLLDGLNAIKRTWPCSWNALSNADADYLDSFFKANAGKAFYYSGGGLTPGARWKCKKWKRGFPSGGYASYTATLEERFDLA